MKSVIFQATYRIYALALSPDEQLIASGVGQDHGYQIDMWNILTHQHKSSSDEPAQYPHINVFSITFSKDGQFMALGGANHQIYVWTTSELKQIYAIQTSHLKIIQSLQFSPKDDHIITASYDKVCSWNITISESIEYQNFHEQAVYSYQLSHSSEQMVFVDKSSESVIWNYRTSTQKVLKKYTTLLQEPMFSFDDRFVASAGHDRICVWMVNTQKCIRSRRLSYKWTGIVAFTRNSKIIILNQSEQRTRLMDISTNKQIRNLFVNTDTTTILIHSQKHKYIIYGGEDKQIRLDPLFL